MTKIKLTDEEKDIAFGLLHDLIDDQDDRMAEKIKGLNVRR